MESSCVPFSSLIQHRPIVELTSSTACSTPCRSWDQDSVNEVSPLFLHFLTIDFLTGPIIGGAISEDSSWRNAFWFLFTVRNHPDSSNSRNPFSDKILAVRRSLPCCNDLLPRNLEKGAIGRLGESSQTSRNERTTIEEEDRFRRRILAGCHLRFAHAGTARARCRSYIQRTKFRSAQSCSLAESNRGEGRRAS